MPNAPTTPAPVASRLTDEEIERLAKKSEYDAIDCAARGRDELHYEYGTVAAVLRDYVRLRKFSDAVINRVRRYRERPENPMCAFKDIKRLAEAEIERLARIAEDDGVLYAEDAGDTAALRDYAAMIGRCEKVIEIYRGTAFEEFADIANFVLKNDAGGFSDILLDEKGATDERK